jgi:hypothetical protein
MCNGFLEISDDEQKKFRVFPLPLRSFSYISPVATRRGGEMNVFTNGTAGTRYLGALRWSGKPWQNEVSKNPSNRLP